MTFPNWLISVDDHVLEPADVWQSRVAAKFRDRAPRMVHDPEHGMVWEFDGQRFPTSGMAAAAHRERDEISISPLDLADLRPGCYDPVARALDMDRDHVLASLCFPSLPRFCGQLFSLHDDKDLGLACIRAYNDWMLEEWSGSVPGRFIPLVLPPLWDPKLAIEEIERCASRGAGAVAFSENPAALGLPSIHDAGYYWDPVFAATADAGLPVCVHAGSSSRLPQTSSDAPYAISVSLMPTAAMNCLTDWLFSGQFVRHPNLKLCLSEGGIGWVPYILERAQWVLDRNRVWIERSGAVDASTGWVDSQLPGAPPEHFDTPLPEVFRRHVFGCFIDDAHGVRNVDAIGIDNVMIETDYPHVDSTWPNSHAIAQERLHGLDDESTYKILQGNARRVFTNCFIADEADLQEKS